MSEVVTILQCLGDIIWLRVVSAKIERLVDGHILVVWVAVTGTRSIHSLGECSMRSNKEIRRDEIALMWQTAYSVLSSSIISRPI